MRYTRFRVYFWKLAWDSWPIRVRLADRSVCLSIKLRAKCGRIGVNGHPIFTFSQNDRVVETNWMVLKAKMYLLSFRIQFLGHFFSMASHGQHCVHEPKTTLKSLICCFVLQPSPSAHSLDWGPPFTQSPIFIYADYNYMYAILPSSQKPCEMEKCCMSKRNYKI